MNQRQSPAAVCPFVVWRPLMLQHWQTLTFLHWSFDIDVVQRLLPSSLTVQPAQGRAWVGLVPFHVTVRLPGVPPIPWASRLLETNVRTYVLDHERRPGIWFFSLDASRLPAVAAARAGHRLPYFWSSMSLEQRADLVRYDCRRRWPDGGATSSVTIKVGKPYASEELSALEHYLTARWVLFARAGTYRRYTRASHEPWPLHHAEAVDVDDGLVAAAGLPQPTSAPLVHYAPGVSVRIGAPQRYEGDAAVAAAVR